jgi:hypothetical protein
MGDASEGGEDRGWACVDVDARRRVLGRPVGQARAQPDASSCSPPRWPLSAPQCRAAEDGQVLLAP